MNWLNTLWRDIARGSSQAKTPAAAPSRPASSSAPRSSLPTWQPSASGGVSRSNYFRSSAGAAAPRAAAPEPSPSPGPAPSRPSTTGGIGGGFGDVVAQRNLLTARAKENAANRRLASAQQADQDMPNFGPTRSGNTVRDRTAATQTAIWSALQHPERPEATQQLEQLQRRGLAEPTESRESQVRKSEGMREKPEPDTSPMPAKVRKLSDEEFAALSSQEQAAVRFNTGLVSARDADLESGGTTNTRNYLSSLDLIEPDMDMDAYLNLDKAISDNILDLLGDKQSQQDTASSLRWSRGQGGAPGAERLSEARSAAAAAATMLQGQLSQGDTNWLADGQTPAGYDQGVEDQVIQRIYGYMVDPQYDLTWPEIEEGLAMDNEANGTNVSIDQVRDFLTHQVQAADYGALRGNGDTQVNVLEEGLTPLSVAEIRQRYGI